MIKVYTLSLFLLLGIACERPNTKPGIEIYDIVVLGGGTGGTAAGIQAGRMGVKTLIVEPTPWLGGMLTSAGVSATDGNHHMPAGIWGEFREQLRTYYGGPDSVFTGWVSNTMFEPSVGADIFREMADSTKFLKLCMACRWEEIKAKPEGWEIRVIRGGEPVIVNARILIDGTELGDVAAKVGIAYDLGMDAAGVTGEDIALPRANTIVQDLTYVAILEDFTPEEAPLVAADESYDPAEFACTCLHDCDEEGIHPCETMLTYGKLPNGKYMVNWPINGNDFYAELAEKNATQRDELLQRAKQYTLNYVRYMQTELGFKNLGLARDEFPTSDHLPFIAYHREGRRIRGKTRLNLNHVLHPYNFDHFRAGIAVGDYPVDHHHGKNAATPELEFPPIPSFSIPIGTLLPEKVGNFLVADKAISVTNIMNGATRLQPVVLQIGQAAGALAAMAIKNEVPLEEVEVRALQDVLLGAGGYVFPVFDVSSDSPHFQAVQRILATGMLHGTGMPYQWANRTMFYPDRTIAEEVWWEGIQTFVPHFHTDASFSSDQLTIAKAEDLIENLAGFLEHQFSLEDTSWPALGLSAYDPSRNITRLELAVLTDARLNPFNHRAVSLSGAWKNTAQ